VLAALHWGPYWSSSDSITRTQVHFHIDNTSAVTCANRRTRRNPAAQLYNRLLSLAEFQYKLVFTASQIYGVTCRVRGRRLSWQILSTISQPSGIDFASPRRGKVYQHHVHSALGPMVSIHGKDGVVSMAHSIYSIQTTRTFCHILLGW